MNQDHDETYHMSRNPKRDLFPYTELATSRPDAEPYELSDDLLNWLAWEFVEPDKWGWVFRGIRKHYYPLKSVLDRRIDNRRIFGSAHSYSEIDRQTAEGYLLSQFKKGAHHFIEASMVPDDNNTLEWLALMQHYGTPTRLLDFTRSPYVACFFALEEISTKQAQPKDTIKEDKNAAVENCAIWAVDTLWLIRNSFRRIAKKFPGYTEDSLLDSGFMAKNFDTLSVKYQKPLILPIVPSRSNPRLLVQQGLFLCPSIAEGGLEKNLLSYNDDTQDMDQHVCKIIIEGRIRTEVLSELRLMNISRASLFPDLQGYASSLSHELEYRSSDEIKRLR